MRIRVDCDDCRWRRRVRRGLREDDQLLSGVRNVLAGGGSGDEWTRDGRGGGDRRGSDRRNVATFRRAFRFDPDKNSLDGGVVDRLVDLRALSVEPCIRFSGKNSPVAFARLDDLPLLLLSSSKNITSVEELEADEGSNVRRRSRADGYDLAEGLTRFDTQGITARAEGDRGVERFAGRVGKLLGRCRCDEFWAVGGHPRRVTELAEVVGGAFLKRYDLGDFVKRDGGGVDPARAFTSGLEDKIAAVVDGESSFGLAAVGGRLVVGRR